MCIYCHLAAKDNTTSVSLRQHTKYALQEECYAGGLKTLSNFQRVFFFFSLKHRERGNIYKSKYQFYV